MRRYGDILIQYRYIGQYIANDPDIRNLGEVTALSLYFQYLTGLPYSFKKYNLCAL